MYVEHSPVVVDGNVASKPCEHSKMTTGVVKLDFSRPDAADGSIYSATVSVGVCDECGEIKLYAKLHHLLADWLRKA